jgi:hypothetical protein
MHILRAGKMKVCNQTIAKVLCTPTQGVLRLNILLSLDLGTPAACKTHFVLQPSSVYAKWENKYTELYLSLFFDMGVNICLSYDEMHQAGGVHNKF